MNRSVRIVVLANKCRGKWWFSWPSLALATVLIIVSAADAPATIFVTLDDPLATGGLTAATGISGNVIVGNYTVSSGVQHGFIYNGSSYTTLDDPQAGSSIFLNGTSIAGISGNSIVGSYGSSQGLSLHGFLYNGTTFTTLDPPGATTISQALGSSGAIIVGMYDQGQQHGYSYNGSSFTALNDPLASGGVTIASGVFGSTVVGSYRDSGQHSHGFIFNGSTYTTLDDPLGTGGTSVFGIEGNSIVGSFIDAAHTTHGFLYNGATFTTIDDPLAAGGFTSVGDISGNTIVGSYKDSAGKTHGFVAQVPEPSSLALFGIGLVAVAWTTVRRGTS